MKTQKFLKLSYMSVEQTGRKTIIQISWTKNEHKYYYDFMAKARAKNFANESEFKNLLEDVFYTSPDEIVLISRQSYFWNNGCF